MSGETLKHVKIFVVIIDRKARAIMHSVASVRLCALSRLNGSAVRVSADGQTDAIKYIISLLC